MTDRLLSASEVAERLQVSTRTVQDMLRQEKLPYCQILSRRRMVPEGALREWIKQNTVSADPKLMVGNHAPGTSFSDRTAENVAFLHAKQTDMKPNDG